MTHLHQGFGGPTRDAIDRVHAALATRPRIALTTLPTPLQEAKGLREALGGARERADAHDGARQAEGPGCGRGWDGAGNPVRLHGARLPQWSP